VGVTHHQANIELHIEEIVLHGAEPADRLRIGDAVEQNWHVCWPRAKSPLKAMWNE
jgi:hypothetical protein